jgi:pimeloyl-ACP methyl ester carboxylesterase
MAPTTISRDIEANGQRFFARLAGDPSSPFLLLLHGFPEYGGAWDHMLPRLADRYFVVAPDQRGYGRSSKPTGVDAYRVQHLAADMFALAEAVAPGRPTHLVGHDWGASVAYAMAFMAPARIRQLVIINGVHPLLFQRALLSDPEQRAASQYIGFLRREDAATLLLADDCRRTFEFLTSGFGGGRWLTPQLREGYRAAWTEPGAMEGMVSWYKATPIAVPKPGETVMRDPLARLDPKLFRVRMPHTLIWGLQDKALRPSCTRDLATFCDAGFKRIEIEDADHWIIHQQPDAVAEAIRDAAQA